MPPFNLETCARPNILALEPYHCARDDYNIDGTDVLLDLNENSHGSSLPATITSGDGGINRLFLHRYPDRLQHDLKQQLCDLRNTHVHTQQDLSPDNLFLGIGSIEAIDALIRCFCNPGRDRILTCPPTYGMYAVSAQVNDAGVVEVPLLSAPKFGLDIPAINKALSNDTTIKLAYFASPGNPTGSLLSKFDVEQILAHPTWNGIVVLDEAYIDFAHDNASLAGLVNEYSNLVVMHTLSKAFGMAGIRLGAAYAPSPIARLLNNLKAPWNIPSTSSALASYAVSEEGVSIMRQNCAKISVQRDRLREKLPTISGVGRVRSGTDSNFLMFELLNPQGKPDNTVAAAVYDKLAETEGVVVRFRGKESGCFGCLRITIGTEDEITYFLNSLHRTLVEMRMRDPEWARARARAKSRELMELDTGAEDSAVDVSYASSNTSGIDQATEKKKNEETISNGVVTE
ncbi:Histidinol-phosphate aminotransferase [Lachnellula subtilissima]|uniref:histidinol-phosphate transaminase n=1 Tax=Lachnellula subtilissima TaxID=602034 RepID=A0A8H8RVW6_9HELO|nr:Histidinol-phosphate aminotransferase [Lachnellula subtilissima]